MKSNKGVTLLELILCISIIAIILSIPVFNIDIFLNLKEKNELKEFITDINYARNRSIIESARHSVFLNIDENLYTIYKHTSSMPKIVKKKEFIHGIQLKNTNVKDKEIMFSQICVPSYTGEIILENRKGEKIRITVIPITGKVNIYYDE